MASSGAPALDAHPQTTSRMNIEHTWMQGVFLFFYFSVSCSPFYLVRDRFKRFLSGVSWVSSCLSIPLLSDQLCG